MAHAVLLIAAERRYDWLQIDAERGILPFALMPGKAHCGCGVPSSKLRMRTKLYAAAVKVKTPAYLLQSVMP